MSEKPFRRGPTVVEIAKAAGLSTSTVDRVLNARSGVRAVTGKKVQAAINRLGGNWQENATLPLRRIAFICEAGSSFINLIEKEAKKYSAAHPELHFTFDSVPNVQVNADRFSALILRRADECEGIILVSRDEVKTNRAVREAVENGVPVICLTTDLPNSRRSAYVGLDQIGTGATAAWLMGRMLPRVPGNILLLCSSAYRAQEEREVGFRRVLRADYAHLNILERVNINDEAEGAWLSVKKYLKENAPMAGIYNMAGGNRGIARALREAGLTDKVLFLGHELSEFTRSLLETGEMDAVLGHDVQSEINHCLTIFEQIRAGKPAVSIKTPLIIYNKNSFFDAGY
ncbi:LacI family DNA-binding transcriptional regulator [Erwinia sp. INIA-01]|uniref:LacI family DNA-binding transcriptional regulator n=1 Tax=Erwinia sp. INIA01 TaxID=2991500 RepID=UPI0022244B7F|nr:LacI family DNA-binding transcriptional regulator [Erwinia sp. INIA01]MCW1876024.1 LacI family DNA-binding transcriptional regulator [Erwinia sp. INIA01]